MKLLYLSRSRYGGWATFTAHLYHGLYGSISDKDPKRYHIAETVPPHEVCRITTRTEKTFRNMGNQVPYRNISEEDLLEEEGPMLITALDKHHRDLGMKLLDKGAFIVIHDPTELRNPEFREHINPAQVIVIRKSMLEHMPEATFLPHPYFATGLTDPLDLKEWRGRKNQAISISRLDFDKNSDWLFEINRVVADNQQIIIRGAENRMYTKTKILPKYPEYKQDSNRPEDERAVYPLEMRNAVNLCRTSRYMTDFSVIHGDGGGTQYTFLEAIDAGAICLLHGSWIKPNDSMIDEGEDQNCLAFPSWEKAAKFLDGTISDTMAVYIRANALRLLQDHEAVSVAEKYYRKVQGGN
jgi:hypothetical protein